MSNKFIILFGLVLLIMPSMVSADITPLGYKYIYPDFQVSNIDNYPDYIFTTSFQDPMCGHEIINQDECISFYWSSQTIYAIKKSDFNEEKIETKYGGNIFYFKPNFSFVSFNLEIERIGYIPETDPREKVVDVLEITSLSEDDFEIRKSKVIYTYTDGTTEEKTYFNQDIRPEPSIKSVLPQWFVILWYFVLPIIALVIIVIVLMRRFGK